MFGMRKGDQARLHQEESEVSILRLQDSLQAAKRGHKSKGNLKMKISKETEKDIAQLQLFEQNLQQLLAQRQSFQVQQMEIENALKEVEATKEKPFKVVGNVMIEATKEVLKEELSSKKELIEMRIKSIETQEAKIKEKAESLQKIIVKELQKEEGK